MPQSFLSPGVQTVEVDQSFLQAAAPLVGAILIGRTLKGPAFYPTTVSSFSQFTQVFGGTDPTLQLPYAAKNYLANATSLTVVRVLGSADGTGVSNGYTVPSIIGITDTSGTVGTTGSILAVIHCSGVPTVTGVPLDANQFVFRLGSTFAATASFLTSSVNYIGKALNTNPQLFSTYGHYVNSTYPYAKQAVSASWAAVSTLSASLTSFLRDYTDGVTPFIKSQPVGGVEYDLFRLHTQGRGRATNDDIKVQIDNVKPSSAPDIQPYGSFDVVVRSFYDTDSRPVELERFSSLTFDPNSQNFILKRIGDISEQFDTASRKFIVVAGRYPLKSQYIRVELNNTSVNYPPQALPWGFRGYDKELFSGSVGGTGGAFGTAVIPSIPYQPNQIDPNGNYNPNITWGLCFLSGGIADRMRAHPDGALTSFVTGNDPDFSLANLTSSYVNGVPLYNYVPGYGLNTPVFNSASLQSFTLAFAGGFDGWDLRVADPLYLNWQDTTSVIGVVAQKRALDCIANPDQIVGDTLALPGQFNVAVTDYARQLVNARKDMFYVMDLTGSTRNEVISNLNARQIDDNYTAAYYPDLMSTDTVNNRMVRVAPSVGVMGALAYNDTVAQAFFAPAGLNRGGLGQFGITDTIDRLNHDDRDALYDARINPITRFPGNGVVIFGQKTLQLRPSALDRVNVRRLLILAKRAVASVARTLVFEPNTPATWTVFTNKVNPILAGYQAAQGVNRFKVVMDTTTNPPDQIDQNIMNGIIFLEPTKAAEVVVVSFVVAPTGVSFGS